MPARMPEKHREGPPHRHNCLAAQISCEVLVLLVLSRCLAPLLVAAIAAAAGRWPPRWQ